MIKKFVHLLSIEIAENIRLNYKHLIKLKKLVLLLGLKNSKPDMFLFLNSFGYLYYTLIHKIDINLRRRFL